MSANRSVEILTLMINHSDSSTLENCNSKISYSFVAIPTFMISLFIVCSFIVVDLKKIDLFFTGAIILHYTFPHMYYA